MPLAPIMIWNPAHRLDPIYEPQNAGELPVNLVGAATPVQYERGMVLGEVLATPGLYGIYNADATDGTQNAKMILRYRSSAAGAGAGSITWVGGEWQLGSQAVPAFKSGDFDLSQVIGLSATALEQMNGRLVEGALGTDEVDSITITGTGGTWGLTIPSVGPWPAVVLANTGLAYNITNANLATAVNNALVAAGVPAHVTVTGGPGATAALVVTFHGALSGTSMVITTDATLITGTGAAAAVARTTAGVAPRGVVRFG